MLVLVWSTNVYLICWVNFLGVLWFDICVSLFVLYDFGLFCFNAMYCLLCLCFVCVVCASCLCLCLCYVFVCCYLYMFWYGCYDIVLFMWLHVCICLSLINVVNADCLGVVMGVVHLVSLWFVCDVLLCVFIWCWYLMILFGCGFNMYCCIC